LLPAPLGVVPLEEGGAGRPQEGMSGEEGEWGEVGSGKTTSAASSSVLVLRRCMLGRQKGMGRRRRVLSKRKVVERT
jgi:hypothetical protein